MTKIKDTRLTGETITLDKSLKTHPVLGPELELVDCTVVNETGADVIIAGLKMRGGTWRQPSVWQNDEINHGSFDGVVFEGDYDGLTFGDWSNPATGVATNCDFTTARLEGVRFLHGNHSGATFPPWPHFSVQDPHGAVDALKTLGLEKLLEVNFNSLLDQDPLCTLVVDSAERIAKRRKLPLDQIREIVEKLPGANIGDPA
jgi:hypothetical protein